jgi:FMN reductase
MVQQVVLAISGSPSSKSRTALVAQHVLGMLRNEGLETKFLSIRDLPAEALLRANTADPKIAEALSLVESAAGIVIATPIFKAAYSGLLKCMLDILPQFALAGKALLPIATGGSVAHVLALDYGLRPVLQSMGARHIVQSHFIPEKDITVQGDEIVLQETTALPRRGCAPLQGLAGVDCDRRSHGAPAAGTADTGKQFYSFYPGGRIADNRMKLRQLNAGGVRQALNGF